MKNILIHGLGQTPSSWEKTTAAMKGGEKCMCPDLIWLLHGKETVYSNLYQAFSAYCTEFQEPVNLCGLSLGGILALQYAIKNPEKVNSLVLIGTQYVMPKRLLKIQNMIFHVMPDKAFQETGFGKREFISLSKSMMDLDFSRTLQEIKCPVLIVCGKKDSANKRAAIEMRQQMPCAKLKLMESAGHEVNVDTPEKLGKLLDGFWGIENGQNGADGSEFVNALLGNQETSKIPKEFDWFVPLLGDWDFDYYDGKDLRERHVKGEWLFRRVLDGTGIEDLFICPSRDTRERNPQPDGEYGAALRMFHPEKRAYEMVYTTGGHMTRLEVKKENDKIVCTRLDRMNEKWVFDELTGESFHWRNITVLESGEWRTNCEVRAVRKKRNC